MSSTDENPINSLIITRESVNNLGPEDDPGPRIPKPEDEQNKVRQESGQEVRLQKGTTGEKVTIGGHQRPPLNMSQIEQLKSENINLKRVLDEKETLISVLTSNLL